MALTRTQISQLYVALLGRASEGNGNTFWMTNQLDMTATANCMLGVETVKTYFGSALTDNQAFIEHLYMNAFNKTYAQDKAGVDYWVVALEGGKSQGEIVHAFIVAAQHASNAGPAQDLFNNKVAVSDYTASKIATGTNREMFEDFLNGVTDKTATVTAAKAIIDLEADVITGVLTDGYIKDATIFADANGDGVWNEGEAKTTTDAQGNFTLEGGSGSLVATGGTDISTGLAFEGTFTAPSGSTTVSPLSSLVNQVMKGSGKTEAQASALVAKALGLSNTIDLLTFDPIAAASATNATPAEKAVAMATQAAAVQVANMMSQAAAMLDGAGVTTEESGAVYAAAALADMMITAAATSAPVVDLTSPAMVEIFLKTSAIPETT